MTPRTRTGPGGISLFPVDIAATELRFRRGEEFETLCRELAASSSLSYFVDEYLDVLDAPRLCAFLDEPARTATRTALAVAAAAELTRRGRRVVIVDGDDSLPDFTRWAGREEREGWVDMIRYGFSLEACSRVLDLGDDEVRFLGVGSYAPTRVSAGELSRLLEALEPHADIVLVTVSTGDRGAVWSGLPSLRVLAWEPDAQSSETMDGLVQDAAMLGSYPAAILTFSDAPAVEEEAGPDWPEARQRPVAPTVDRESSPLFRRLAVAMAALVVLVGAWWLLQPLFVDDETERARPYVAEPYAIAPAETARVETAEADVATIDTTAVDSGEAESGLGSGAEPASVDEDDPRGMPTDPVAVIPDDETPPPADEPATTTDPALFARTVADLGWCLHVFSFRDDVRLERGLRMMEDRGFNHAVKRTTDRKGLLLRVYTGSFASRREAREAMPEVFERLETTWAQPVRAGDIR